MTATITTRSFERETCSRCSGSGEYSYCQMYGRKCFKCLGQRQVLTKRGAAAKAYLATLRSRTAGSLKVGDTIKTSAGWAKVLEMKPITIEGVSHVNGVAKPYRYDGFDIDTDKILLANNKADNTFEILLSAEEQRRTMDEALAYQATLTREGNQRKV